MIAGKGHYCLQKLNGISLKKLYNEVLLKEAFDPVEPPKFFTEPTKPAAELPVPPSL